MNPEEDNWRPTHSNEIVILYKLRAAEILHAVAVVEAFVIGFHNHFPLLTEDRIY